METHPAGKPARLHNQPMSESALQTEIERFGRLYVASSQVSHAVVRSRSREELLNEVVRVLVEVGKFAMAFICWHDPAAHELVPVARFGDAQGYADRIRMFAGERPEGQGPAGTAFRTGIPYVCNDFLNDPGTLHWQEEARACGWRASAAFPIPIGGLPCGLLSVYALEPGMFGPDQVELLRQVTFDVAFGVEHLDGEARRRQVEAALRESEARLKQAVRVAHIGIFDHDHVADTLYVSPRLRALQAWSPDERLSLEAVLEAVHPGDRERIAADVQRGFDPAGDGFFDVEHRIVLPGGAIRWTSTRAQTFFDGEGSARRPVRTVGAITDITERNQAEAEKGRLEEQLFQAQKMESIGRLAGGVAHDFNNLLTVINGYSQLALAELEEGDPLRATIAEIHKAGQRAEGLTRQLLAFSRKQVLQPRVLDLNRVVREMQPMLERLVGEDVEVRVSLDPESGTVNADPHQVEQVIMNLAVNARDAMPGGGRLLIETAGVELDTSYTRLHPLVRKGRYVMLAVSDSGRGMDEETRQRIFEPFFTTKPAGQGTGMGLSTVQGIAAQSGGHIDVYSEPDRGTTFKLYLPALAEPAPDRKMPAAVPVLGGKETVLVVEDVAEVRDYAVSALKAYGYHVIQAASAAEALHICERERAGIQLVLTDVVMPNVSGWELANQLEKLRPGIHVLFMSGYTDDVIALTGVLDERVNFIEKPFSPEELARKVRSVLGPPARAARILVADDEAGVRRFLRAVLEGGGYEAVEAEDGKQALEAVRTGQVDLVITDLVMSEQEGIETIQALRREAPGVALIAISGAFEGQFLKIAQLLGADAVLRKPVSAKLLLATVAEALNAAVKRGGRTGA
jgi:PAS domain S-box-containing protein